MKSPEQPLAVRALALALWAFAVWLVLTWTVTAEQLTTGAVVALLTGIALAPLGDVVPPWRVLDPRRLGAVLALVGASLGRIVRANIGLASRIWSPRRPLRSGMVIVPTLARTDAQWGASGLITSLIVDNQIVDLDTGRDEMLYHAVDVPDGDGPAKAESVNAPTERLLLRIDRR